MASTLAQTLQASVNEEIEKRNREWEDLNYDERTDRLMEVVTMLWNDHHRQAKEIHELRTLLDNHEHDEQGGVYRKQYAKDRYYPIEDGSYVNTNPLNVKAIKEKHSRENEVASY